MKERRPRTSRGRRERRRRREAKNEGRRNDDDSLSLSRERERRGGCDRRGTNDVKHFSVLRTNERTPPLVGFRAPRFSSSAGDFTAGRRRKAARVAFSPLPRRSPSAHFRKFHRKREEPSPQARRVPNEIHEARKELLAGKDWTAAAKHTETARDVTDVMREGEERMYELYQMLAGPVSDIVDLQKGLRSAPSVRLDTPAVVLVGSPNVGKSSIVRAVSSATPEVNNYPFTTRGMTLGHVEVFWSDDDAAVATVVPADGGKRRKGRSAADGRNDDPPSERYAFSQLCQVMDSPGLLARPDDERNEMEALTLAAMRHLPTAVMYIMDLSGGAGDRCSSVEDQLRLRKEVRARFPRRPWIDVVSKIDLGVVDGSIEKLEGILDGAPYLKLSITEDVGVEELRTEVMRMLGEVRVVLDAMAAVDERSARPASVS